MRESSRISRSMMPRFDGPEGPSYGKPRKTFRHV
jgi:hypothetical protein